VVYFSTTQFPVHRLIPPLQSTFHVPVAVDIQDMWAIRYYDRTQAARPPGGRLKFQVANWLAFRDERRVLPAVDGLTAVSPAYSAELEARYPALAGRPRLVLPFGAAESGFETLRSSDVRQSCFSPRDGLRHW